MSIILASQSPRRKDLLALAQIKFEVHAADIEESYPEDMALEKVPEYIACQKANAIKLLHPDAVIIAADTIVVLGNKMIGKPEDNNEAITYLKQLSGNKHKVITGVVIKHDNIEYSFSDTTEVEFNPLCDEEIHYYVDTFQPSDKAGAYAVQEWIGAIGIKSINGCYYNVMGLPISKVYAYLKSIAAL